VPASGQDPILIITGAPGSGKTTASEAADEVSRGLRVDLVVA
jgi:broad-specificity NMP kinase